MHILFLSRWLPYPPNNGSKLRIYHLLAGLATQHKVSLISFAEEAEMGVHPPALDMPWDLLQIIPWKPFTRHSWQARRGFLSLTPSSISNTHSPTMVHAIKRARAKHDFDLVIASQLTTASYVHHFAGLPALFEEVELGLMLDLYQRASSLKKRLRRGLTWLKHRHYLTQVLHQFRACTVVSERERQLMSDMIPSYPAVEVIPNCVNLADYTDIEQRPQPNSLIFTGSFRYYANYEAINWFLCEVFPLVQTYVPDVCLTVTGDHANLPIPAVRNVRLTGSVPDVRPLLASAWCSIVPMHSGGGTRLKILEAMAVGTPVVTTAKGAEGIEAQHDVHLLIADTPQAFADSIMRLLHEPCLRQRLADAAYHLVSAKYAWSTTVPRFLQLIEQVEQPN